MKILCRDRHLSLPGSKEKSQDWLIDERVKVNQYTHALFHSERKAL